MLWLHVISEFLEKLHKCQLPAARVPPHRLPADTEHYGGGWLFFNRAGGGLRN